LNSVEDRMKNASAETEGYLNVRNCILYSLANPAEAAENALAIRFTSEVPMYIGAENEQKYCICRYKRNYMHKAG
jgi:hypothetical protein